MTYTFVDPTDNAEEPLGSTDPTHTETHKAEEDAIVDLDARLAVIEDDVADLQNQPINTQTDSYTLDLADNGKIVEGNKATALSITVPPNADEAFPVGARVDVVQLGAGALTIVAGSGVTIRKPATLTLVLAEQYAAVTLYKRATNEWLIAGNLTPA